MDPATFTLLVGLCGGAFMGLTLLYLSIPYPPSNEVVGRIPKHLWNTQRFNTAGRRAQQRRAA